MKKAKRHGRASATPPQRQHRDRRSAGTGSAEAPAPGAHTAATGPHIAVRVIIPIIVCIATFLAYYPALSAGFVNFDDGKLLQQNTGYQGLSTDHLEWMFTTTYMGHYQPLTWLSYALDYQLSGTAPRGYHLTNLILHALNAMLVYFVSLTLMGMAVTDRDTGKHTEVPGAGARPPSRIAPLPRHIAAAVAALLFGIHPLRVESVAWVSERRDVLSVLLLILATITYLKAVAPGRPHLRSRLWYVGSICLLALSLLAKAWGMTFFIIITLLNVFPLRRLPWRIRRWLDKPYGPVWLQTIPFLILGLLAAFLAARAQGSAFDTMKSLSEWSVTDRLIQACYGLAFYIRATVWPTHLAVLYPLPHDWHGFELRVVVSILAVLTGMAVLWRARRRAPALLIAGLTYCVWLAPVLGFAQSGPQLVADRYSYVACIGWVIALGSGLALLWTRRTTHRWRLSSGAVILMVLGALFLATLRQTRVWHDSESLWAHAVSVGADSTIAHRNRGLDLRRAGDLDGSIRHFRVALSLDPNDGSAWYLLATNLKALGRYEEAEKAFRHALEHLVQKHLAWQDLGIMYYEDMDRLDDAIHAFRKGIDYWQHLRSIRPAPAPRLYLYLGMALRASGDFANARTALETATKYKATKQRALEELELIGGGH